MNGICETRSSSQVVSGGNFAARAGGSNLQSAHPAGCASANIASGQGFPAADGRLKSAPIRFCLIAHHSE